MLTLSRGAMVLALCLSVLWPNAAIRAGEGRVVHVYNWTDYIAHDTVARFTRETGIWVVYDVYEADEVLDTKLMAGHSGYDVVFPSASPFFAQQVRAGVFQPLDLTKLPHAKGVDPQALANLARMDPDNRFGLPYLLYASGFGYDVDAVAKLVPNAPTDSWAMLFDPAVAGKLKACGVTLLDTPVEVVPAMLAYLGRDPHSQSSADLNAAMAALTPLRGDFRYMHSSRYINDLAKGDICVAHGWLGDLVQARARAKTAKHPHTIAIVVPKEGAPLNVNVMAIPANAPDPEAAHAFMDFLLRPEIIAEITNETGYANAVPAATPMVDPALRADPAIYPPPEVQAHLFAAAPHTKRTYDRTRAHAWTKFRAGRE